VLAGRAKSISAQFYVAHEPDKMAERYKEAWLTFGINTDELLRNTIQEEEIKIKSYRRLFCMRY
jgi:hypothetical protein